MDEKTRDLLGAMDRRAEKALQAYEQQHSFEIGTVEAVTYAGICVKLGESGRYLRNIANMQGTDVTVGTRVLVARVGRQGWVVVGALERWGSVTPTYKNDNVVGQPQSLEVLDRDGVAVASWMASYFDIAAYEIQFEGASTDDFRICAVTDNTQFFMHPDSTPSDVWVRVRAVGPEWQRGGVTEWVSLAIADPDDDDYLLTDGTRNPTGPIENFYGTYAEVSGLTPATGAIVYDTTNQRLGVYTGADWIWVSLS